MMMLSVLIVFQIVSAETDSLTLQRQQRLNFGHVLMIESIQTQPSELIPGQPAKLIIKLTNTGNYNLLDLRTRITLPSEFSFIDDVSQRMIAILEAQTSNELTYEIIALPGTVEGVYNANITNDYLNHIGDEREDSDTFGIVIQAKPRLYSVIESTELTTKNNLGKVSIQFVNNEIADIKFFTVQLKESPDYTIISSDKAYIGKLDSDDFQSADFRIKLNTQQKTVKIPLIITYKDKLNKDYNEEAELNLVLKDPKDLGINTNGSSIYWVLLIIVLAGGYYVYRRRNRNKKR
jgi:hypothetical protein